MRNRARKLFQPGLAVLVLAASALAQNPLPPTATTERVVVTTTKAQTVIRRPANGPSRVIVAAQSQPSAPQVVTVVHQLSGLKLLRLMIRQGGEQDVLAKMSEPLAMTNEVHTNIIAGLVLDDGKTVAVWLPQAAAEIERPFIPPLASAQLVEERAATMAATPGAPNLSVVLSDGKRVRASYVGLDGTTGVSVLLTSPSGDARRPRERTTDFATGQRVRLVAPQRDDVPANAPAGTIYVRVGETPAKIERIMRTSAGKLERLTASADNLSPAFVGGIALDESGATIGIVERVEGDQVRILPSSVVQSAVRRVLQRQASVPRPLLGVSGEPVEFTSRAFFLAHGWPEQDLVKLFEKPVGILLTSVLPGTPAAQAKLQPGDVIVRVNEAEVRNEDDFSSMLSDAGSGAVVNFTLLRPTHPAPESIVVKLGSSLEPFFDRQYFIRPAFPGMGEGPLARLGIETVALSASVASAFGAQGGLLVVGLEPEGPGALTGVREGDLIVTVDGRPVTRTAPFLRPAIRKHALSIVRDRQRIEISIELKPEPEQ